MTHCKHTHLSLLPSPKTPARKLRCRQCHLTIDPLELEGEYCPECLEVTGKKVYDFETIKSSGTGPEDQKTRYRCESCGIIIDA